MPQIPLNQSQHVRRQLPCLIRLIPLREVSPTQILYELVIACKIGDGLGPGRQFNALFLPAPDHIASEQRKVLHQLDDLSFEPELVEQGDSDGGVVVWRGDNVRRGDILHHAQEVVQLCETADERSVFFHDLLHLASWCMFYSVTFRDLKESFMVSKIQAAAQLHIGPARYRLAIYTRSQQV